ncbi:MAG: S8 family peptidase, partial [Alphaproteobacteria bacterium]
VPEVCVGTTYTVTEYSGRPGGLAIALGAAPAAVIGGLSTPTGTDDPQTGQPQDGAVPQCTKTPTAAGQPAPGATPGPGTPVPPVVVATPETTPPRESDTPDLGLVKAQESLVSLVVAGGETGQPVEGAVVKLLGNEPALPLTETADSALTATANYKSDVQAAFTDGAGTVQVAPAAAGGVAAAIAVEVVDEAAKGSQTDKPASSRTLVVGGQLMAQFVVAAEPGSANLRLQSTPAQAGLKACVSRTFAIGNTPVFVVNLPVAMAKLFGDAVAQSEGIEFFEKDPCRNKEQSTDPHFSGSGLWGQEFDNQWAIKRVGFDATKDSAWARAGEDLQPVTVAVIDSGLDWYHPDIPQASLWRNKGEIPNNGIDDDGNGYIDDIIGWNMIDNNAKPWDHDGHGTFVTGIIAAARNNGIGISGINPAARIMVLKALDPFGRGHASMIAEAITYAANNGARVINLSLGGRGLTNIEQIAVDYARFKGAVLVVAAGNAGIAVKGYSPGGLKGVITVTATDRNDRRAGFSNWGSSIDIAAPGIDVLSLRARNTDVLSFIKGVKYEKGKGIVGKDRAYFRASGTSFAAPIVSATLSLIMSKFPGIDAEKARRMVLNSARDIATPGIDNFTGYGLLNAAAALQADPEFYVESRITGVKVLRMQGKLVLQVSGTSLADKFQEATLMVGKGNAPKKWLRLKKPIAKA